MLVECGAVKPLCDTLTVNDTRIIIVALEGLENILKVQAMALWINPRGRVLRT